MWKSRKFRAIVCDAAISAIVLLVTTFVAPDWAELVLKLIAICQPAVIMYVLGIAIEDAAAKRANGGVLPKPE